MPEFTPPGGLRPGARLHRIVGDGLPRLSAVLHAAELRRLVVVGAPPSLDAALVGLGAGGAVGSLAPGSLALEPGPAICRPARVAGPPHDRISVTMDVLRAARQVVLAAAGADLAEAVAGARGGRCGRAWSSTARGAVPEALTGRE